MSSSQTLNQDELYQEALDLSIQTLNDEDFARQLQEEEDIHMTAFVAQPHPSNIRKMDAFHEASWEFQNEEYFNQLVFQYINTQDETQDETQDAALARQLELEEQSTLTLNSMNKAQDELSDEALARQFQFEEEAALKASQLNNEMSDAAFARRIEEEALLNARKRNTELSDEALARQLEGMEDDDDEEEEYQPAPINQQEKEYSHKAMVSILHTRYPGIPLHAIEFSVENMGDLDKADTRLFKLYPKEYYAGNQDRSSVALNSCQPQQQQLHAFQVTKLKNKPMKQGGDSIQEYYLALATRNTYTIANLERAFACWSKNQLTSNNGQEFNDSKYMSARWNSEDLSKRLESEKKELDAMKQIHPGDPKVENLLAKVKRTQLELRAANLEAGDLLFVAKNPKLLDVLNRTSRSMLASPCVVDLHLLHISEALRLLNVVLMLAQKKAWNEVTVITGKGNHSSKEFKMGPEVKKYLQTCKRCELVEPISGGFQVKLFRQ